MSAEKFLVTGATNGMFAGEDQIIAAVTGQRPMTVQEFVTLHRAAFNAVSAAA